MNRYELETLYTLNDPATSQAIKMLPLKWHSSYSSYIQLLELSNELFDEDAAIDLSVAHRQCRRVDEVR